MPVHVAVEGLRAPVRHLHRPPGSEGKQAGVDLRVDVLAGAERSTDACKRDPYALRWKVEARRDLLEVDVQPLRRRPELHASVLRRHRQGRLGPERRLILHRRLVVALDPHVRDCGVGIAANDVDVAEHVPELVDLRRFLQER
jgi:hypothetical protein